MNDVILRQAAIDAHCELCGDKGKCADICPDVEVFRLIPSQPQRTGRWIQYGDEFCCSECGGWAYMDECDEGIKTRKSKFCPECGARMEKE